MDQVSTKQLQIAERARRYTGEALTVLQNFIDEEWLAESLRELNKKSAAGVDGKRWEEYDRNKSVLIPDLHERFKSGRYKAPPVRRIYIEKANGGLRPLGIPTIEDKVLQNAVRKVIDPIYDVDFHDFSYGFRRGRSAHGALERVWQEIMNKGIRYVLEGDIEDFYGGMQHGLLREFLDKRVRDGVIRRQIDKWLKAGVMEEGKLKKAIKGTPQGGIISPLLSNIYLHQVLDEWYVSIKSHLFGESFLVRYADDWIMGFAREEDAIRVMKVIFQRFMKYGLTLHPGKTRLVELDSSTSEGTFDFLGFTHYWGTSKKGNKVLKRRTSHKSFNKSVKAVSTWIKRNRHCKLADLIGQLNLKLRGHYSYYGITFNFSGISRFYYAIERDLFKWINRRGGKKINWESFGSLVSHCYPLLKPYIVHSYL
jgi:RNA-directed DNA polymerase